MLWLLLHLVSFVHRQVIRLCAAYFMPKLLGRVCRLPIWTLLRWAWLIMTAMWWTVVSLLIARKDVRKHCTGPQWSNLSEMNATGMIIGSQVPFGRIL